MKYPVCAMRDEKVGYLNPSVEPNIEVAKRSFAQMCSQAGSVPNFAPGDFALYLIAEYDTDNGVLTPVDHVRLIDGAQLGGVAYGG